MFGQSSLSADNCFVTKDDDGLIFKLSSEDRLGCCFGHAIEDENNFVKL